MEDCFLICLEDNVSATNSSFVFELKQLPNWQVYITSQKGKVYAMQNSSSKEEARVKHFISLHDTTKYKRFIAVIVDGNELFESVKYR